VFSKVTPLAGWKWVYNDGLGCMCDLTLEWTGITNLGTGGAEGSEYHMNVL
jgi:hypothetical protein